MDRYIKDKNGYRNRIEVNSRVEDGKVEVFVNFTKHHLKAYFRHERTWNDHMGNTPCGYYVIVPLPTGERRRFYIY